MRWKRALMSARIADKAVGRVLVGIAGAALLAVPAAHAVEIDQTYDITAAGFSNNAATDPVNLVVTLQFDNSASFGPTTSGLTVDSFNHPYSTEYEYDQGSDILTIATEAVTNPGSSFPYAAYLINPNTYGTFIANASTLAPNDFGFSYTTGDGVTHDSSMHSATASGGGGPEPSTWALMMVGVFGAGWALRRRRRDEAQGQALPA